MNNKSFSISMTILVLVLILINAVTYTLSETEQAIILEFGKPLRTVKDAGLHFKAPPPFNSLEKFERRLLIYDTPPNAIITQDKKNLIVDAFARWTITDPLLFRQTVRTESGAQARLDDIIYSDLLRELGQHTLDEIVSEHREEIMAAITHEANLKAPEYGIEILDVRIKRTDLPRENEEAIYRRMRAERQRIANLYRSEGEEEALKIRADADKQVKVILANKYKESQVLRGDAEGKTIRIYADAYNRDASFYEFMRSMEMYKLTLNEQTTLVLPPDSKLFKYLK